MDVSSGGASHRSGGAERESRSGPGALSGVQRQGRTVLQDLPDMAASDLAASDFNGYPAEAGCIPSPVQHPEVTPRDRRADTDEAWNSVRLRQNRHRSGQQAAYHLASISHGVHAAATRACRRSVSVLPPRKLITKSPTLIGCAVAASLPRHGTSTCVKEPSKMPRLCSHKPSGHYTDPSSTPSVCLLAIDPSSQKATNGARGSR